MAPEPSQESAAQTVASDPDAGAVPLAPAAAYAPAVGEERLPDPGENGNRGGSANGEEVRQRGQRAGDPRSRRRVSPGLREPGSEPRCEQKLAPLPMPVPTARTPQRTGATASAPPLPVPAEVAIGNRLVRLERVETLRQAGRIRCRVVLAAAADHYSAVADCAEEPLAELQLAARVTCDALRAGGFTQALLEGATVVNLAGGMHVLVALSGWNRGEPNRRSGSAGIGDSAERAAALAVLYALANT